MLDKHMRAAHVLPMRAIRPSCAMTATDGNKIDEIARLIPSSMPQ
jgi:hypothetical protein